MTKSELIESVASKQKHLPAKDVELAIKHLLELMSETLADGQRIEIRGFGSFSLHYRPPADGPQSEDRRTGCPCGQIRAPFQAGQGSAGARQRRTPFACAQLIRTHLARAIFRCADANFGLTIGDRPLCARSGCFSRYSWLY